MKKILVLFFVLVATSTSLFAIERTDYQVFYRLNNESTFTELINFLDIDKEQVDFLKHIFSVTAEELRTASKTGNEKVAENVLNYNLYNTKCILSDNQYKKYLLLINLSINSKSNDLFINDILISDLNK